MLSTNSTSSHTHYDATKTHCVICSTEIDNQSSNDTRKLYKLCTKYLHSGIAKEFPYEGSISEKDDMPLCGKCCGSAEGLAELTQTLALFRKRVSEMVFIFSLEILHRRGKNTRKQESEMNLIQLDVSRLPGNDSWSRTTFIATDEIVSTETQENFTEYHTDKDKGENVETVAKDLDVKSPDIVEVELMTEAAKVTLNSDNSLGVTSCANSLLPVIEIQESMTEISRTEIAGLVETEFDTNERTIKTAAVKEKDPNALRDTNDCEIAIAVGDVEGDHIESTINNDQRPKNTAERVDQNILNGISMPILKLHRLRFQWKPNSNGQDLILVNDGRCSAKASNAPKPKLLKIESEDSSCNNNTEVLNAMQNLPVPSTSKLISTLPIQIASGNSKGSSSTMTITNTENPVNTPLKKTVGLLRASAKKISELKSKRSSGESAKLNLEKRRFHCTVCKKTFLHKSHWSIHKKQHQKTKFHKCLLCSQLFSKNQVKAHRRVMHGNKVAKCSFCDKEFLTTVHLNNHVRIHTGEKPFKCAYCGKSFRLNWALICHIRTHTGEKPFKCASCGKSFSRNESLTFHMRTHTGEKPFKCDQCDYSCAKPSNLTVHKISRHSNIRNFKCRDCQKTFKLRSEVKLHHKRVHVNIEFSDDCIISNF